MKILIVDDEPVSRNKMQTIVGTLGQCEAVENGEDALKVAASENPPRPDYAGYYHARDGRIRGVQDAKG